MNKNKMNRPISGLIILIIALLIGVFNPKMLQQLSDTFLSSDTERSASQTSDSTQSNPSKETGLQGPFEIKRVVDGDTVIVHKDSKEVKVRLLGINAPESVHEDEKKNTREGKEASKWLKDYLNSQKIYLEYDKEPQDQFGRDLAYLYLEDRTTMVNEVIISQGLAKVVKIEPNVKYFERLKEKEKSAKQNKKGFWGSGFYK